MKDTWALIAVMVAIASSIEEATQLVDEEIAKGEYVPIPKHLRDERIKSLWEQKVFAQIFV